MAVRDQELLTEIQYAVIEPPNGGASWPSGLWTRDEVLGYLNQRQDRLLRESLLLVGVATIPVGQLDEPSEEVDLPDVISDGAGVVELPADWLATFSVVWRGNDGTVRELVRSDTFEADHADQAWSGEDGTPLFYIDRQTANRFIRIAPFPSETAGVIELWYIPLGAPLNGAEILTVPDELAPSLKYGTLADMLKKDGRAKDDTRSQYCEERFQMGIEAAALILDGFA